ncbi:phage protein [Burkholderia glumae]|uniref:Bacteriophage protein n=1 Tax=Burkholderia glumae TaxID=337 RepID=A0ABY5B9M8_BURGL|nr:hypothetical protein [Burkholderia glumae]MCM2483370.1 hypothetical protein [Burkholderia glumae]MCM2511272.1 hypothetical protein [Burkholderia glumae]MCM2541147.1 hypothetical protein [Burkholderia glumae]MCM2550484.1 hypothetical protein [Burkholderia glumae]QGA40540.1 hypothetical protein GAS19_23895 [Burkholderia glumae]
MTEQFGRKFSLIVGEDAGDALDFSDLRVKFDIKRGDRETPNSAFLQIYNLSDSTSKRVEKEFTRIVIQAGYPGNFSIVFDGEIKQIWRGRDSPTDTFLNVLAADGDSGYCFAKVIHTLAAGWTYQDLVNTALQAMAPYGVTPGYMAPLQSNPMPRGRPIFDLARDVLRKVARANQMVWSIQDGRIIMVPETSYAPYDIPEINSATGMVGWPVQMINGITFKTLLNPSLKVGGLVHLNNCSIQQHQQTLNAKPQSQGSHIASHNKIDSDGFYYLMSVNHKGDTRGNEWYSDALCLAVDATTVAQAATGNSIFSSPNVIKRFG